VTIRISIVAEALKTGWIPKAVKNPVIMISITPISPGIPKGIVFKASASEKTTIIALKGVIIPREANTIMVIASFDNQAAREKMMGKRS